MGRYKLIFEWVYKEKWVYNAPFEIANVYILQKIFCSFLWNFSTGKMVKVHEKFYF